MINWTNLAFNSLWVFALALALSTLGFARWEAFTQEIKLKQVLQQRHWVIALNVAGSIFTIGMCLIADVLWERIVWGIMALLFLLQLGFTKE